MLLLLSDCMDEYGFIVICMRELEKTGEKAVVKMYETTAFFSITADELFAAGR